MFAGSDFNKRAVKYGDLDDVFDEKGNKFLAIRKVAWVPFDEDPNEYEDKARLEIRTWMVKEDGKEIPLKGIRFLTDNGPNELTKALVREGYGDTKEILTELRNRNNFNETLRNFHKKSKSSDDEQYFDMRSLLVNEDVSDNENDDEAVS